MQVVHPPAPQGRPPERAPSDAVARLYVDEVGYVMNLSRVWGHLPEVQQGLFELVGSVADDPCATRAADLQPLREVGFDDRQVAAVTMFCALRLAFSTVNDALGAGPDAGLTATTPSSVRQAVTFGRPVAVAGGG